jgi:hypothetical protein
MPQVLDGLEDADWRPPGLLIPFRAGQVRTGQAKQGKSALSTRVSIVALGHFLAISYGSVGRYDGRSLLFLGILLFILEMREPSLQRLMPP